MYEQSSESAHACVVKYIRARLPSQARRAGLVRVWAPLDRSATVTGRSRTCISLNCRLQIYLRNKISSHEIPQTQLYTEQNERADRVSVVWIVFASCAL
jgi:hypothetical protein